MIAGEEATALGGCDDEAPAIGRELDPLVCDCRARQGSRSDPKLLFVDGGGDERDALMLDARDDWLLLELGARGAGAGRAAADARAAETAAAASAFLSAAEPLVLRGAWRGSAVRGCRARVSGIKSCRRASARARSSALSRRSTRRRNSRCAATQP
jgi:hypothetical protein